MKKLLTGLALALLAMGVALTGCTAQNSGDSDPAPDPAPAVQPGEPAGEPEIQPEEPAIPAETGGWLSAEELRYFNEEFFNGDSMNIRNQFLSSSYDSPEQIDLYELFYCGTGREETMAEEEWIAFEAAGGFVETDVTKISAANADAVLLEHTGLTVEETDKICWNYFTYLPEYDAYYNAHGDTNYRGEVTISAGERAEGLLRLYYEDAFYADGWKCVTLRETESGGYHFVSNGYCDPPAVSGR